MTRLPPRSTLFPLHDALPISTSLGLKFLPRRASSNRDQTLHGKDAAPPPDRDRKSTRLNSSHVESSYAVFCLKKKPITLITHQTPSTPPTLFRIPYVFTPNSA